LGVICRCKKTGTEDSHERPQSIVNAMILSGDDNKNDDDDGDNDYDDRVQINFTITK